MFFSSQLNRLINKFKKSLVNDKLGNIVLGDGRVECDWSKANSFNISNFAPGTHDHKLDIPTNIIPVL